MYARSINAEASHASFGPIKQLAAEISYSIPSSIQLFGENMFGVHSLEYDRLESFLYIFAALESDSHWLSWDHVTELANEASVPMVPLLTRQTVSLSYPVRDICFYFLWQFETLKQVEREISTGMSRHSKCGACMSHCVNTQVSVTVCYI